MAPEAKTEIARTYEEQLYESGVLLFVSYSDSFLRVFFEPKRLIRVMDIPEGPITWFPANGLPHCSRHITSHSQSGLSLFATSDHGDHHRLMARGWAHQNILYSTPSVPTDLNNEADIAFSKANEVRRALFHVFVTAFCNFVSGTLSARHSHS